MINRLLAILLFSSLLYSCQEREDFSDSSDIKLAFSTDTVMFDTIFTSIGSTTRQFRFYNNSDKAVRTSISLAGGSSSYYRLNIDGAVTDNVKDYEIMPHDSCFVFVEVNIDPQNANNPMVITDSIVFVTNGNVQDIKLVSYGQDVHLYNDSVIDTRTWVADKPYLIYNSVLVAKDNTLTIEPGVKIYFHNESAMFVAGNLKVEGSVEEPVIFSGDRLDEWYDISPGQWYGYIRNDNGSFLVGGVFFLPSSFDNVIDYAIIKNGAIGIQLFDTVPNSNLKLTLSNSIVKDMSAIGLYTQFSNTLVYNTVLANCGYHAVYLSLGGHHEFYHTTIGNYYEFGARKTESLVFNNYYTYEDDNGEGINSFDFSAIFVNSIVYGNLGSEFLPDLNTETAQVGFLFDHCMMKLSDEFDTGNEDVYKSIIRDRDSLPNFINTYEGNFRLDTLSAAKDRGSVQLLDILPFDQDGNDRRVDGKPDIGAYERVEE